MFDMQKSADTLLANFFHVQHKKPASPLYIPAKCKCGIEGVDFPGFKRGGICGQYGFSIFLFIAGPEY